MKAAAARVADNESFRLVNFELTCVHLCYAVGCCCVAKNKVRATRKHLPGTADQSERVRELERERERERDKAIIVCVCVCMCDLLEG